MLLILVFCILIVIYIVIYIFINSVICIIIYIVIRIHISISIAIAIGIYLFIFDIDFDIDIDIDIDLVVNFGTVLLLQSFIASTVSAASIASTHKNYFDNSYISIPGLTLFRGIPIETEIMSKYLTFT